MWFRFWLGDWLWVRSVLVADALGYWRAYRCRGNDMRLAGAEARRPFLDRNDREMAAMVVDRSFAAKQHPYQMLNWPRQNAA